jgi:hypothetical protein
MTVREKDGKKFWTRLGVAFPAKQGPGWNVFLDSIPASTNGQYRIFLMEPKVRVAGNQGTPTHASEDDIPF